ITVVKFLLPDDIFVTILHYDNVFRKNNFLRGQGATRKDLTFYINGVCTEPVSSEIAVRDLDNFQAITVYANINRNQVMPPLYECIGEKIKRVVFPKTFAKYFDELVKVKVKRFKRRKYKNAKGENQKIPIEIEKISKKIHKIPKKIWSIPKKFKKIPKKFKQIPKKIKKTPKKIKMTPKKIKKTPKKIKKSPKKIKKTPKKIKKIPKRKKTLPKTEMRLKKKLVKKIKKKSEEIKKIKKTLNLIASTFDITDEEEELMKSSRTTLNDKIKLCENIMKKKFTDYEDNQGVQWTIEELNFFESRYKNGKLECIAELTTTTEVNEKQYNQMVKEPGIFKGFDESINVSNVRQKTITKNPFMYKKLKLIIIVVVAPILFLLLCLSCFLILRKLTNKPKSKTNPGKKKSRVIKKVRTNPKIAKKSSWYHPVLKALKIKKRDPNNSYTYIIYYIYYEVSEKGDKTTKPSTNSHHDSQQPKSVAKQPKPINKK
ncbi:hypothetical protein SNEBB_006969, partial [Seison nebaliae]